MEKIVTKDYLKSRFIARPCPYCSKDNYCGICENGLLALLPSERIAVLGRALVAIYNNQTTQEKQIVATVERNGVGFSHSDARVGTLGAKEFIATKTLAAWQVKYWLKDKGGYPKICKYANQLNQIANERLSVS